MILGMSEKSLPVVLDKLFVVLRFVAILCMAGWAGAAAALQMWGEMIFFLSYLMLLYVCGRKIDDIRNGRSSKNDS